MIYKATITLDGIDISETFPTVLEAAEWLDSKNNNRDAVSEIRSINEPEHNKEIIDKEK